MFTPTEYLDDSTKKSFERIQRARIERKFCDLQLKRGIVNIKEFNNVNDLFKEEGKPPMTFYVDSFNDMVIFANIKTEEDKETLKQQKIKESTFYY